MRPRPTRSPARAAPAPAPARAGCGPRGRRCSASARSHAARHSARAVGPRQRVREPRPGALGVRRQLDGELARRDLGARVAREVGDQGEVEQALLGRSDRARPLERVARAGAVEPAQPQPPEPLPRGAVARRALDLALGRVERLRERAHVLVDARGGPVRAPAARPPRGSSRAPRARRPRSCPPASTPSSAGAARRCCAARRRARTRAAAPRARSRPRRARAWPPS